MLVLRVNVREWIEDTAAGKISNNIPGATERKAIVATVLELAVLKFGQQTADELSPLLRQMSHRERMTAAVRFVAECDTGEDLIARTKEVASVLGGDLPPNSLISSIIMLLRAGSIERATPVLEKLFDRYDETADASLIAACVAWIGDVTAPGWIAQMYEGGDREDARQAAKELVLMLATHKYGREQAEEISPLLDQVSGQEGFSEITSGFINCDTVDELVALAREAAN